MERRKIISVFLYLSLALAAALLLLSYVHATSIGTNVSVTGTLTVTDTSEFTAAATFNGNVTVGNLATADTLTVTARLAADLDPNANNTIDLGAYDLAFKNIFASSTAYLDFVSSTAITLSASSTLTLTSSTTDSNTGVIYKGSESFIHNFSHPTGSTAIPDGQNTFVGLQAGNFTMGSEATAVSYGSYNTGIGYKTLTANTTGYKNTAIGLQALYANTTGNHNTANGDSALYANTTGYLNTANGRSALYANTTGYYNTADGVYALKTNTTGYKNTAIGLQALYYNTTGNYNTANGTNALLSNTTGGSNTALGYEAGRYIGSSGTTANQLTSTSLYIGALTRALNSGSDNENVFGYGAVGLGTNSVVLGNTSVSTTLLNGNVGITTSTPRSLLQVSGASGATTSTIWVGDLTGIKGQICMGDTANGGASCLSFVNGVLTTTATTTY